MNARTVVILGFLAVTASGSVVAQEKKRERGLEPESLLQLPVAPRNSSRELPAPVKGDQGYRDVFGAVQTGLAEGNVGLFSIHLGTQVSVTLRDGESGYYSTGQAFYILENYLRHRRIGSLSFTTVGESETNPFATGGGWVLSRGGREHVQVYVGLTRSDRRWLITQLTVY